MKFYEMVSKLQEKDKGYIVLVRNGIFFCGIGKDAVTLNKIFNYKPVCFKNKVCKCGIPVNAIEVGIKKIQQKGYSYIIYDYNKEKKEIIEIGRMNGKIIEETKENIGCKQCWYYNNRKKQTKEYVENLKKIIEEEK